MSGKQIFTLEQSGNEEKNVKEGEVSSFPLLSFRASALCVKAAFCICHRERFSFPWQLLYVSLASCYRGDIPPGQQSCLWVEAGNLSLAFGHF